MIRNGPIHGIKRHSTYTFVDGLSVPDAFFFVDEIKRMKMHNDVDYIILLIVTFTAGNLKNIPHSLDRPCRVYYAVNVGLPKRALNKRKKFPNFV
jgi:hypothetical protein